MNDLVKEIASAIKKVKTGPYDTTATVVRIDGETVYVHIEGGADETPAQKTISCKKGDKVKIRVSGGKAWITGNLTSPPTDDSAAEEQARVFEKKMGSMSSSITQTAKEISSKVSKGDIISTINQTAEAVKIRAGKIEFDGNTDINGNVIIGGKDNVDGTLTVKDADGETVGTWTKDGIYAISGKIGGWNLTEEMFYAGTEIEGEWDNCIRPNRITMLSGTLDMQNGIGSFKSLSSDTCDVTTINATTGNFTNIACSGTASHGGDIKFTALARYVRGKDGNVIIGENAKGRLLIGNNTQTSNLCGLTTSTTSTGVSFKICNGVGIVDTSEDELDVTDSNINIYLSGGTDATSRYIRSMPAYQRTFGTSSPAMRISDSGTIGRTASSSARYKHDITALSHPENVTQEIENSLSKQEYIDNINSLLDLPVSAFKYNKGYFTGEPNYDYDTVTIGFIAEDVAKFCPDCAIYQMETVYKTDENGEEVKDSSGTRIPLYDRKTDVVESWSEREFIPKIVYLLQQQDKKIKELEQEIASLKESR